jgi:hypothetical protein
MPTYIDQISPEQEAQMDPWVDKWTKIGLSTEPMDFERAKKSAEQVYKELDLHVPKILPASSPKEASEIHKGRSKNSFDTNKFYSGNLYAAWGAFITFFRDVMDWEDPSLKQFKLNEELMLSCGWVLWDDDVCIIVDRPELITLDDNYELHGEEDFAIKWRDGWGVPCWHGTRIPKEWILNKDNLDPSIALTWENVEQRRCAAEIIGWNNVLNQLDCKVIDEDGDPEVGTLIEVELPEIGKERFLRVLCGTKREFALPVPPEMTTAIQAQAWTWDMELDDFKVPEVRT